ncbi:MAG TPA: hypothetical protein VM369_10245 [Candidatus Binatia bacterium]|nr:hypothetical protein [Candidatus Binatia bacterium]
MRAVLCLLSLLLTACAGETARKDAAAPLFTDLGNHHHAITTASPLAQRYFDQGLTLAFGFNHAEAERSFRQAAALDPACAMCWWGVALVLGPNINVPMDPAAAAPAWEAIGKARERADAASAIERAYIEALARRYAPQPPADRSPLDQAFAAAAGEVARKYPQDLDARALYAEALLDQHPWDYYDAAGKPRRESTRLIVSTLESVLKDDPRHAWAIHLYIHATEASDRPQRAEAYADRLTVLVPGAGHLVHMPGHTYMRVGRYHDAVLANERATAADDSYLAQCQQQGVYPIGYVPHNHHFLYAAAAMLGNRAEALKAAASTDAHTAHGLLHDPGFGTSLQHYSVQPLFAYVRFGEWQRILAQPEPAADLPYPAGVRHYARGRAHAALGELDAADRDLAALEAVIADPALAQAGNVSSYNSAVDLLRIAAAVLGGEIAAQRQDWRQAVARLTEGVKREDALHYNEPSDWNYPVRHSLGAVLLAAGRPAEAERVYREDLRRNPDNGWSLFGLMASLDAQKKRSQVREVRERLVDAWRWADIELTGSRL